MFDTSSIYLSLSALENNLRFIRKRLNPGVRLCSVVKGNAYGHGLAEFVKMARSLGQEYFAVHSAAEAWILSNAHPDLKELFIMGDLDDSGIEWAISQGFEFTVYDFSRLKRVIAVAEQLGKPARVHLEVETGMRRTGFEYTEFPELINCVKDAGGHIELFGLFTHFAGAESMANNFRVDLQWENFKSTLAIFQRASLIPRYYHAACSAGLLNYPQTQGNMVRIGILQYGYWPNKETHIRLFGERPGSPDCLKRIITWKSRIMAIKNVRKGQFVGYGTSYFAYRNQRLAVIPVGYSHGYGRNLSNIGEVLIKGKLAQVAGTVNMNSITVNVTDIEDLNPGEEVVLIGRQGKKSITVGSFSEQSKQLNYEMLTRLPGDIKRYIEDDRLSKI
jgi:alanine racemase